VVLVGKQLPIFDPFRLVGGTALALQIGHRMSVDIDLFTDAPYDSLDFNVIDSWLRQQYPYATVPMPGPIGFGRFYFVGNSKRVIYDKIYKYLLAKYPGGHPI
jgi:hypothetical protein